MSSVFDEEKALARRTGRCLACDGRTPQFAHGRSHHQLCGDADCLRVYLALYHEAHRERRLRRQRQRTAERRAANQPQPEQRR